MIVFVKYKLENIGEYCVICDNKLDFHGIKPTICDSVNQIKISLIFTIIRHYVFTQWNNM